MPEQDLTRMKADLAAIKEAAGITDEPQREDVTGNILLALSGACAVLWTLLAQGAWHLWGLLPVVIPVGYILQLRHKNGAAQGGSPRIRQEFAESCRVLSLAIPFTAYSWWALRMGISPKLVLSTAVFFVGVLMLCGLLGPARRMEMFPWCAVFMLGALIFPATPLSPILILGLMLSAAGLTAAAILRSRLKSWEKSGLAN